MVLSSRLRTGISPLWMNRKMSREAATRGGQVAVKMSDGSAEACAECYFANPEFLDDNLAPYEWYRALVVAGALEHDLPEEYVRQLRDCPAIVDTDPERTARASDLLNPLISRNRSASMKIKEIETIALVDPGVDGGNSRPRAHG